MKTAHIQPPEASKMAYPWALVSKGMNGATALAWLVDHVKGPDGDWYWLARKYRSEKGHWSKTRIKVKDYEIVHEWANKPRPIAIQRARARYRARVLRQMTTDDSATIGRLTI